MAAKHKRQHFVRLFHMHECSPERIHALLKHMQLLMHLTSRAPAESKASANPSQALGAAASNSAPATKAGRLGDGAKNGMGLASIALDFQEDRQAAAQQAPASADGARATQSASPAAADELSLVLPGSDFWAEWAAAVISAKRVLRNSYILLYYRGSDDLRTQRFLEYLQAKLIASVEPLLALIEQLPHAQKVAARSHSGTQRQGSMNTAPGAAPAAGAAGLQGRRASSNAGRAGTALDRHDSSSSKGSVGSWLLKAFGLCRQGRADKEAPAAAPASYHLDHDEAPDLSFMEGPELQDQIYYTLALVQRTQDVAALAQQARKWERAILAAARAASARAAEAAARAAAENAAAAGSRGQAAGSSSGAPVALKAARDLVAMAASSTQRQVAWSVLSEGVQQIWSNVEAAARQRR